MLALCFHLWARGSFIVQSDQEKVFHEKQNQPRPPAMDLLTTTFDLFSVCPFTCHQGWWKIFDSAIFFSALSSREAQPLNVVGRLQRTCRKRIILDSSNTPWTEKGGCFDTTAFTLPLRSQENGKNIQISIDKPILSFFPPVPCHKGKVIEMENFKSCIRTNLLGQETEEKMSLRKRL